MAAPALGPPPLRQRCLQLLAAALLEWRGGDGQVHSSVALLPEELRAEVLLLLAGWQLLEDTTCALLSPCPGTSVLAGAAAVSLAHCTLLGRGSLARLLGAPLPMLRSLSLRGLARLVDADVALVAQHCPALQQLDLSKNPELTAAAVAAVAGGAAATSGALQALSLAGCWQVAALPGLSRCTALTSVDLGGCWQLTDGTVHEVGSSVEGTAWACADAGCAGCSDP